MMGTPTAAGGQQGTNILIRFQEQLLRMGYFGAILLAFLGGFLMNLMPCVLPVISLKVLSFVRQAHDHRWRVFRLGLTYAAGILVFYLVFAELMYHGEIGWGELFQNSIFVLVMAAIVLALALSLFGVFTIFTPRVVDRLEQKAESHEGYLSAFSTGLLATLLGTACTAPLLSVAIAYASRMPQLQGSLIFIAAGLGMALPFVMLTYNPTWLQFVPKPGPWMLTFEHVMGFVLSATVIWVIYPLRRQLGDYGLYLSLIFLLAVAIAAYLKGKIEFGAPAGRKVKLYAAILLFLCAGWFVPFRWMSSIAELKREKAEKEELIALGGRMKYGRHLDWSNGMPWQHYTRDFVLRDVADGYTVFVDYTADWCASCKSNKKTSLEAEQTIKLMQELSVIPYEADYTSKVPQITEDLKRFGRAGVPMYLVYKPGDPDKPEVLPEILTPTIVIEALKRAGPSHPKTAASP
jgi:thiol:disulfide interchange protein